MAPSQHIFFLVMHEGIGLRPFTTTQQRQFRNRIVKLLPQQLKGILNRNIGFLSHDFYWFTYVDFRNLLNSGQVCFPVFSNLPAYRISTRWCVLNPFSLACGLSANEPAKVADEGLG